MKNFLLCCRLCLSEETLSHLDKNSSIMIRTAFSLNVRLDDDMPSKICKTCLEFLHSYMSFRNRVFVVQKILKGKSKHTTNSIDDNTSFVSGYERNLPLNRNAAITLVKDNIEESSENLLTEIIKSIDLGEAAAAKKSQPELSKYSSRPYCEFCQMKFVSRVSFRKHLQTKRHSLRKCFMKSYGNLEALKKYVYGFSCVECGKLCSRKSTLVNHSRIAHNVILNAKEIKSNILYMRKEKKKSNSSEEAVAAATGSPRSKVQSKRTKTIDTERQPFSSEGGAKFNKREGKLVDSRRKDTSAGSEVRIKVEPDTNEHNANKNKPIVCRFCTKTFCFTEAYMRHMVRHHNDKFWCEKCDFISASKSTYVTHLRDEYKLTKYHRICGICFKICANSTELCAHRQLVHASCDTIYHCTVCKLKFHTVSELKSHKRTVHWRTNAATTRSGVEKQESANNVKDASSSAKSSNRRHRCRHCNRKFSTKLVLKMHQCMAKKFPCPKKCGKRFVTQEKMSSHEKRCILGTTIYSCEYCKKKNFSSLKSLKQHVQNCKSFQSTEMRDADKSTRKIPSCLQSTERIVLDIASISANYVEPPPNVTTTRGVPSKRKLPLQCKKCHKKFDNVTTLESHFLKCTKKADDADDADDHDNDGGGKKCKRETSNHYYPPEERYEREADKKTDAKQRSNKEQESVVKVKWGSNLSITNRARSYSHAEKNKKGEMSGSATINKHIRFEDAVTDYATNENVKEKVPAIGGKENASSQVHYTGGRSPISSVAVTPNETTNIGQQTAVIEMIHHTHACDSCGLIFNSQHFLQKHISSAHNSAANYHDSKPFHSSQRLRIEDDGSTKSAYAGFANRSRIYSHSNYGGTPYASAGDENISRLSYSDCSEERSKKNMDDNGFRRNRSKAELTFSRKNNDYRRSHNLQWRDNRQRSFTRAYNPSYYKNKYDYGRRLFNDYRASSNDNRYYKRKEGVEEEEEEEEEATAAVSPAKFNTSFSSYSKATSLLRPNYILANNQCTFSVVSERISPQHRQTGNESSKTNEMSAQPRPYLPIQTRQNMEYKCSTSNKYNKLENELTVVKLPCEICSNKESHLFCKLCKTCFNRDQRQYLYHMKTNHS